MTASEPPDRSPASGVPHLAQHRVQLLTLEGTPKEKATVHLPLAFSVPVRLDLIRRAVDAARSHRRQPYGTGLTSGRRHSVRWSGKGKGVSRSPRLMDSMTGAQAPNTVGGGRAHPPKVERIWAKKINIKERRLAFASALAATRVVPLAEARGHTVPKDSHLPFVLEDPVERITTASAAREVLEKLHLWDDVERARDHSHMRAGRGKIRGRVRRTPRSVLVVTSGPDQARGFRNLAGVEVVSVQRLATEDLAPGGDPGRMTLFSHAAVEGLRARLGEASA
ncbi:MAG: 50S ribosomal protein L4 [Thermoplasmata archaeon]|jgi:large subunit ribosomal protein L4e